MKESAIVIPRNEYKEIVQNVYDALCTALTAYEEADEPEYYNKGHTLYEEIVGIEERLGSFIN